MIIETWAKSHSYLIVHVFYAKSDSDASGNILDTKMKPTSIVFVRGYICSVCRNPKVVLLVIILLRWWSNNGITWYGPTCFALLRFPESKQLSRTIPSLNSNRFWVGYVLDFSKMLSESLILSISSQLLVDLRDRFQSIKSLSLYHVWGISNTSKC